MIAVILTPEALEQFNRLPLPIRMRMRKLLDRLEFWPAVSGFKPLRGALAGYYRLRTGDYRLRFRPENNTLLVDKIGHRKDVYDD